MKTTHTIERGEHKGARVSVDHTNVALLRVALLCLDKYKARQPRKGREMVSGQILDGSRIDRHIAWILREERAGYLDREPARVRPVRGKHITTFVDEDYIEGYTHNATLAEIALWALNFACDDDTDAGVSDQLQNIGEKLEGELLGIHSALRKLRLKQERRAHRSKAHRNGKGKRAPLGRP